MVNKIYFNWLCLGPLKDITEVNTTCWSHPAVWGPTDNNFIAKILWPRAKGVDYAKKELTQKRQLSFEKPACDVGPWLASGNQTGKQFPTLIRTFSN